jgi:thiol peroxidase
MAAITLRNAPIRLSGELPEIGTIAPDFELIDADMREVSLKDFAGSRVVLNVFPSIDTSTCATSVRKFNERASGLYNTKVLCISRDLPFAQKRFCGAEGIENVVNLSDFKDGSFGRAYGIEMLDGKLSGLHARAVIVLDQSHKIVHTELIAELADEPNYNAALAAL